MALVLTLFGFLMGSLPLAYWIGRSGLKKDIRAYGDHNPGAFNVLRAGGFAWGGLAIVLEVTKGALPVGLAVGQLGIDGWGLVACAIAPILGHAFSPFLKFRGGKAIAVTFGVWIGLTIWPLPFIALLMLVFWYFVLTISGWAVLLTFVGMLFYLLLTQAPWEQLVVFWLNLCVILYRHRADLMQPPRFRVPPPFLKLLRQ